MTIIILFNPYSARLLSIVKVGSSASSGIHKRHNNNSNYDIFVVCGSCHSSKAFSRKHNEYLCPFCDKGGEELPFPIHKEEIEVLEQREEKTLDLSDLGVRYRTTDGKTLDKPATYDNSSARSFSGRDNNNNNAKAIYQITNSGSRTRRNQKSDFDRTCELDDQTMQQRGGITITSDEIIRNKSNGILDPSEIEALKKGDIGGVLRRRSLRTW